MAFARRFCIAALALIVALPAILAPSNVLAQDQAKDADASPWAEGEGDDASPWAANQTQSSVVILPEGHSTSFVMGRNHLVVDDKVYDQKTWEVVGSAPRDIVRSRAAKGISPDGRYLLVGEGDALSIYDLKENKAQVVSLSDRRNSSVRIENIGMMDERYAAVFSRDRLHLVQMGTGRVARSVPMDSSRYVAVDPDGKVAAVFDTRQAGVFDLKTGRRLKQLESPDGENMPFMFGEAAAFSPDIRELAAVIRGPRVLIWNLSGKLIADHYVVGGGGVGRSAGLAWAPDGKSLLVGDVLIDRNTGMPLMKFKRPSFYDDVPAIFLSQDRVMLPTAKFGGRGELTAVAIPWDKINKALEGLKDADSVVGPGKGVRLRFDIRQIYHSSNAEVEAKLSAAMQKALKQREMGVDASSRTVMLLLYNEQEGELREVVEGFGRRSTGQSVHAYKSNLGVTLIGPTGLEVWKADVSGSTGLTIEGEISDRTVRNEVFESLLSRVANMPIPSFIPADPKGTGLPIEVSLER